ncbi:MAG: hypothetical protein JNJ57_16000 [Saprospiraceae bacterium]|nr:hypothetical protein [Saprospiraceae bacterium]
MKLLVGAGFAGLILAFVLLFGFRQRFSPVSQHLPEVMFILVVSMLFMPLFASLLNRHFGEKGFDSFVFVAEKPFVASGYGILKGEKVKTSGYRLTVQEHERYLMFKYKSQSFFPNTKPGESVLLPVSKGLFGIRVVTLK